MGEPRWTPKVNSVTLKILTEVFAQISTWKAMVRFSYLCGNDYFRGLQDNVMTHIEKLGHVWVSLRDV